MSREGIKEYEEIMNCQILDKYNLTDRKVPTLTVKGRHIRFNLNAIHMLGDAPYVKILVNPDEKYLLVLPCESEYDINAIDWCKVNRKSGKTESKDITSKFLSPKLYDLMGWEREYSYRIQCFFQNFGPGRTLLFFDLNEYVTLVPTEQTCSDGKVRKRAKPYYLANWKDSFGPPLSKIMKQATMDYRGYYAFSKEESTEETTLTRDIREEAPESGEHGEQQRIENFVQL